MGAVVIDYHLYDYHEPRETLYYVADDILHCGTNNRYKIRIFLDYLSIMFAQIATETDKVLEIVEIVSCSLL